MVTTVQIVNPQTIQTVMINGQLMQVAGNGFLIWINLCYLDYAYLVDFILLHISFGLQQTTQKTTKKSTACTLQLRPV